MAEKEYLLGNRAKELYLYTKKITKPVADDRVESSDVIVLLKKIAATPNPQEISAQVSGAVEALQKRHQRKRFPKSETFDLVKDLRDAASRIIRGVHSANECMFNTEYRKRLELIKGVLDDCNFMLQLIQLSLDLEYIDLKRCEHWTKLVTNVKYMCASWKKKDTERARLLIKEEEIGKLSQQKDLLVEIVKEVLARNN